MTAQNSEKITYWQDTDTDQLWVISQATADSIRDRLLSLRPRQRVFPHTNIGATAGSVILDTGVQAPPAGFATDVGYVLDVDTYVLAQTLAASQQIGILVRAWNDAGAELQRVEASYGVEPAANANLAYPVSLRQRYAAGASYRVTVDIVRRSGAGNMSATPAYSTNVLLTPAVLL